MLPALQSHVDPLRAVLRARRGDDDGFVERAVLGQTGVRCANSDLPGSTALGIRQRQPARSMFGGRAPVQGAVAVVTDAERIGEDLVAGMGREREAGGF